MMIALVIRSFVLVGVLGWYSANVWKMIDGYFKDKFDKYLQEEYIKNPLMKKNLQLRQASTTNKPINQLNQHQIDPITIKIENENKSEVIFDVNLFPDNRSINNYSQQQSPIFNEDFNDFILNENKMKIKKSDEKYFDEESSKLQSKTRMSNKKKEKIVSTTPEPLKKKKKIKTLMLSENDFKSTRIKLMKDFDFSEFEHDDDDGNKDDDDDDDDDDKSRSVDEGSLLVASLPYKPKADIGDLDRITEDEFCPINLNYDDGECGKTKKWP